MRKTSSSRAIRVGSLDPLTFAPFGEVIQNPATHDELDGNGQWRLEHQIANQGTATKWLDVTHMENWYERAASRKAAKVVMNMFVCKPRSLQSVRIAGGETESVVFPVKILERHPYTPQTFVPMGVNKHDPSGRYLVIVAPTLPTKTRSGETIDKPYPIPENKGKKKGLKEKLLGARPNPFTNDFTPSTTPPIANLPTSRKPKGVGEPDLQNLKAFIARGDQAVTYGPGTWHAPMVVLGDQKIEFVVVQYANGVGVEDCQECEIDIEGGGDGLIVDVDVSNGKSDDFAEASKPGYMRAKL